MREDRGEVRRLQLNRMYRRMIIAGMSVAAVGLLLLGITGVVSKLASGKDDTTKGLEKLEALEAQDAKAVSGKLKVLEKQEDEEKERLLNRTPQEKFIGCLLLGDSITQGLYELGILDPSLIIAERGIQLTNLKEVLEMAENLSPKALFLCYGTNDIPATRGDAALFKTQYQAVLEELKGKLPDTPIYVNSILPVQQKKIDESPDYLRLPEFNVALQELCKETGVTFIDNTDLVKDEFYGEDGVHLSISYYELWVNHMAEVANL